MSSPAPSSTSSIPVPPRPSGGLIAPSPARKLDNGLTLIVREHHDVAVATVDVWVGTGAAHETPEIGGISHFLEHMLFKGTERFALGQIETEIENIGGISNAGTSYDFTHYYVTMPSASVERALEMFSEMVGYSTLDPTELEKERLVILEEYRRKMDDPEAMLFEDTFEQLYVSGPYHSSVIGSEETIRSITREQMADYYDRHYAPENITLIVTGHVNTAEVETWAQEYFGRLKRPFRPLLPDGPAPSVSSPAKKFHRARPTGGETYMTLACTAPGFDSPDDIVPLDLAQCILGQGRASVLYQSIRERQRLASTISCHYWTQRYDSTFMFDVTCTPENQAAVRKAIDAEVERFVREPIPEEQFRRALRLTASGHLFSFETTTAASSQIGYFQTLTGGTDLLDEFLERLARVKPEEVQKVFKRMLDQGEWVEVSVGPEIADEDAGAKAGSSGEGGA